MARQYRRPCITVGCPYPAMASDGAVCIKCSEAARIKAHNERPSQPKTDAPAKAAVAYCTTCLTTQYLRDINPATNTGICVLCRQKQQSKRKGWSLAASYGWAVKRPEPNGVY